MRTRELSNPVYLEVEGLDIDEFEKVIEGMTVAYPDRPFQRYIYNFFEFCNSGSGLMWFKTDEVEPDSIWVTLPELKELVGWQEETKEEPIVPREAFEEIYNHVCDAWQEKIKQVLKLYQFQSLIPIRQGLISEAHKQATKSVQQDWLNKYLPLPKENVEYDKIKVGSKVMISENVGNETCHTPDVYNYNKPFTVLTYNAGIILTDRGNAVKAGDPYSITLVQDGMFLSAVTSSKEFKGKYSEKYLIKEVIEY